MARERPDPFIEGSVGLYGVEGRQAVAPTRAGVVLAVGRCGVDESSSFRSGHVVAEDDGREVLRVFYGHVVEWAPILSAFQVPAFGDGLDFVVAFAEDLIQEFARQDQALSVRRYGGVLDVRGGGDGGVGDQGPRRRRPDEEACLRFVFERQLHVDARVGDVLVAHGDLGAR